jgi:hypothetical protein
VGPAEFLRFAGSMSRANVGFLSIMRTYEEPVPLFQQLSGVTRLFVMTHVRFPLSLRKSKIFAGRAQGWCTLRYDLTRSPCRTERLEST